MTDTYGDDGQPQDHSRTMRDHAGEAIVDARNWPGYVCIGAALALMGLTLTAAASGFEGWAWMGAVAVPLLALLGVVLVLLEHKRVKAAEGKSLTDPGGH